MTRYRTIVADPPWPVEWHPPAAGRAGGSWPGSRRTKGERPTRGLPLAYETAGLEAIAGLDVAGVADDDALLFLWATRAVFREGAAAAVARAWGFEPCGEIIWGLRNPGLGARAAANDHEPILVARRGRARLDAAVPLGVVFWRQVYGYDEQARAPFKVHSAKPDGLQDLVEQVSPGPYLELYARRQRLGWDTWGDEALPHVELGATP